jgi:hypothetical protein
LGLRIERSSRPSFLLMRPRIEDRAQTYRIHRIETDSPNIAQLAPYYSTATGPTPLDRASPTRERSACVIDQPRLEDSRDFERQCLVQSGRLRQPEQHLYFPAWGEAPARIPACFHNSIHRGVADGRESFEWPHERAHAARALSPITPSHTTQWVRSRNACQQPRATPSTTYHALADLQLFEESGYRKTQEGNGSLAAAQPD